MSHLHAFQKPQLKAITQLAKAASKDESRYHLTHVEIKRDSKPGIVQCTVTDGHKLVQILIEEQLWYELAEKPIYLSQETIKRLETEVRLAGKLGIVIIPAESLKIETNINYPKVEQLIPKDYKDQPGCVYGINLCLIDEAKEALKACANRSTNVACKVYSKDALSPVIFEMGSRQDWCTYAMAVVMPMRI